MSLPVSRRSFLSIATTGVAVSALGLAPAADAARKRAAAPATPGVAAAAGTVYLNLNEHPLGPSPAALDAATRSLARAGRYLVEMEQDLCNLMTGELQLPNDHLSLFPGSRDALNRAGSLFTSARAGLVVADPSFDPLIESATARGVAVRKVPLHADGAHDVKAMMAKADPTAGMLYLCNPGNATGAITPRADIEWLLANKPASAVLMVDEAYIHYSNEPSVADLVRQRQDLIVLRSFSKLYGMAGLRLGAALASPGLQTKLAAFGSNPLSVPAMAAGIASLRDPLLVQTRRAENARV
ncbi:aminotransferase class I/II-fold pyridoxal phosphate-dependent enzyme, partial [Xanthomonas axonopodis]